MIKSDLIHIFKKLTKSDRRALKQFVRSPYFNRREEVVALYDYINKYLDATEPFLDKSLAFKVLFPTDKTYQSAPMDYAMSFLLQTIRSYLIQDELEKEVIMNRLLLHKALDNRGLHRFAQKELEATKATLQKSTLRNAAFHRAEYDILLAEYRVLSRGKRLNPLPLQPLSDALDAYYLAETLRHASAIQSHLRVADHTYSYHQPLLKAVLSESMPYHELPAVAAQYYVYHCFDDTLEIGAEESFRRLKQILENQATLFTQLELRVLYLSAINYCIRRVNMRDEQFYHEVFSLYKTGLANEALLENGVLSAVSYRNIAIMAIKVREFAWAEQFLNQYKDFLPKNDPNHWYDYYRAVWHYRQGNYDAALHILLPLKFNEPTFNMDARCLLIEIYYQNSETSLLESMLESTKMYLLRHSDIGYPRENYENFIKYLKKILHVKPYEKAEFAKLKAEIESIIYIYDKEFFINILNAKITKEYKK